MTDKDRDINERLLFEFNLEPGPRGRVCDRETGEPIRIKQKEVLVPGSEPAKFATEFDPINSVRQMNHLFGVYVNMLQEQEVIEGDVVSYGTIPARTPGTVRAVMKVKPHDKDEIVETASKPYKNETSAYADLVCRINGDDEVDMSPYDIDRIKQAEEQRKAALKAQKFKTSKKR